MKGPPSDTPNLDDILARDFAELKVGEANIRTETPPETASEVQEEEVAPIVYNQRIDAVEDRESFAVKAPDSPTSDEEKTNEDAPAITVLKSPTTQEGDDFDVDW